MKGEACDGVRMTLHTQGLHGECSHEARLDPLLGDDTETLPPGLKQLPGSRRGRL